MPSCKFTWTLKISHQWKVIFPQSVPVARRGGPEPCRDGPRSSSNSCPPGNAGLTAASVTHRNVVPQ